MTKEKEIFVKKRDGQLEKFDIEKIHNVVTWAINGISDVSLSDIEMNAKLSIQDGVSTQEIHKILIESAANLITEKTPNYQFVAGRMLNYQLRKDVWGGRNSPKLYDLIKNNVENELYDLELLKLYSKKEIDKIDEFLDHARDLLMPYCSIKQFCDKYLVQNRDTKKIYETPQFAYILIAMVLFQKYPSDKRLQYIKKAYNAYSRNKVNLPTPLLAGARSNMQSYASCCLIDVDDRMDSIMASNSAVGHATSQRYGIGFNFGRVRAIGRPIRGGEVLSTGAIPFLKIFEATVKSCQQGGLRGGSATVNFPIWHYEIQDILVLKNNAGTDDNRVRKLDYCIGFSKLFYDRYLKNENITLFSPDEVKGLYESFGHDNFDELYVKYENDPTLKFKKVVRAQELFALFIKERVETGRIYVLNVDHVNSHGPWLEDVKMSNLCVSPDTLILTKDGYKIISELENQEIEVYNGEQWSKTKVVKTGTNQSLVKVILKNGLFLDCTEYHKFYTIDTFNNNRETETKAIDLKSGDLIETIDVNDYNGTYVEVQEIKRLDGLSDTYCVNEPLRHRVVFNGILTSNCLEINQPLIPLKDLNDKKAEIGVCVLSAINIAETKDVEIEEVCDIIVRGLEELIDLQTYFCKAAENFATKRRSLGIGITNLAGFLAKNAYGFDSPDAPNFIDEIMEKVQFFLLKSSLQLAKERGSCKKFNLTKYSKGILPLDTYKKTIDKFVTRKPSMDWEGLRKDILKHGLRHSSLTAMMPCESSSVIQSSTNGCEPVRSLITSKNSKTGNLPVLVPGINKYSKNYTLAFNLKDMKPLININATIQKWCDMSMSTNLWYNYDHYENKQLPDALIFKDMAYAYSVGLKTLYYLNTDDGDKELMLKKQEEQSIDCEGGACKL